MTDWFGLPALKPMFWRLDDNHTPVQCETWEEYLTWAEQVERGERDTRVALTNIGDDVRVSTVFLRTRHGDCEHPEFFETMVRGEPFEPPDEPLERLVLRYRTWDQAAAGHARLCPAIVKLLALPPAELAANLAQRPRGRFRFIGEEALAWGLPEEVADNLQRAANKSASEESDQAAAPV